MLVLIKDITNEIYNKNKKADGESALYSRRLNLDKKEKSKSKDNSRDNRDKDSKKDKLYKNYRTQICTMNLIIALLQTRSFAANRRRRQIRSSCYINQGSLKARRIRREITIIIIHQIIKTLTNLQRI